MKKTAITSKSRPVRTLAALAAILALVACGVTKKQTVAGGDTADTQIDTPGYTALPGTRVSMKIPDGFAVSPYSVGIIVNDRQDQIIVQDNIVGNYYENAAEFTHDTLDELTPEPVRFEELKIEGYDAKFSMVESSVFGYGSMFLVFGDSTFCTMISVIYDHKSSLEKDAMKEALMSVKYNRNMVVNPADIRLFEVVDNSSGFVFSEYSIGVFFYSKDNPANPEDPHKVVVTSFHLLPPAEEYDIEAEQIRQLRNNGHTAMLGGTRPRRFSLNGYDFRECVLYDRKEAWYSAVLADTAKRQCVSVLYKFAHDIYVDGEFGQPINLEEGLGMKRADESKLDDIKEFVQAIRLKAGGGIENEE